MSELVQALRKLWKESELLRLFYVILMFALIGLAVRACTWAWNT
jgi:hypothetical protein